MKVYSFPVMIAATAYVRAGTEADALAKLAWHNLSTAELPGDFLFSNEPGLPVSGLQYDDPELPEVSLSPAVTFYAQTCDAPRALHIIDAECVDEGTPEPVADPFL